MTVARILGAAALLAATSAAAEDRIGKYFAMMDTDHDGFISREEFTVNKGAMLYAVDANHDNRIERGEIRLSNEEFTRQAGADGTIDNLKFFTLPAMSFEAFDLNGDNRISRNEFGGHVTALRAGPQAAEADEGR